MKSSNSLDTPNYYCEPLYNPPAVNIYYYSGLLQQLTRYGYRQSHTEPCPFHEIKKIQTILGAVSMDDVLLISSLTYAIPKLISSGTSTRGRMAASIFTSHMSSTPSYKRYACRNVNYGQYHFLKTPTGRKHLLPHV